MLADCRARSGSKIRILRTDGDGIFGRSKNFQALKERESFIHERPAPYDHNQSAIIDRECRTLLEGVNTSLDQSGAPSNFWGDAADHFVFTRNIIPRVECEAKGKREYKSPDALLEKRKIDFNLRHLVAFGTQVTCYIPPDKRSGHKTPGQDKAYDGVILGYVDNMQAYLVWDLRKRKKREVSFFHSVVHEGFYPFKDKKIWTSEEKGLPAVFTPRLEDILTPIEFSKFGFSEEEEKEILAEHFSGEEAEKKTEKRDAVAELDFKHMDSEDGTVGIRSSLSSRTSEEKKDLHTEHVDVDSDKGRTPIIEKEIAAKESSRGFRGLGLKKSRTPRGSTGYAAGRQKESVLGRV